ncbi:hypothetical protein SY83_21415 [Paenibacillus swuensis]|uniref:AraC family transcriptional regulator n=1 Tax=Paenibacillus swuensis TaxID=1178515 RepID=A0A172TN59_9BACL|nr:response regulator [Paenibacillus swuensis]ANE48412.1 hypothetical protein SY83_21415 [Paenibacillus swuensis]
MIRAMIVDDERLVRKGFISTMPLHKYNIEIVAEERNGKAALETLLTAQVDLLFTDLTMPVMGGFELIEQVRTLHPHIKIVVLTCHEDFKFIQKALRMGAIDYIVKLELEEDMMEEVLKRITGKMATKQDSGEYGADQGFMYAVRPGIEVSTLSDADWDIQGRTVVDIDLGFKLVLGGEAVVPPDAARWFQIRVEGLRYTDPSNLAKRVQRLKDAALFYEEYPENTTYLHLNEAYPAFNENEADVKAGSDFCTNSLAWLYNDAAYNQLLMELRRLHLHPRLVRAVFYSAYSRWSSLIPNLSQTSQGFEHCLYWQDWISWLERVKKQLLVRQEKEFAYSRDIVERILEAVEYISKDYAVDYSQDELARKYHLSRSYFSQSFKDIVGKPFQQYCKDLKLAKAKQLLLQTDTQVGTIATLCGYDDTRYFSRIFREETGLLPTEFRQAAASSTRQ